MKELNEAPSFIKDATDYLNERAMHPTTDTENTLALNVELDNLPSPPILQLCVFKNIA
jgi:hypothetical protein